MSKPVSASAQPAAADGSRPPNSWLFELARTRKAQWEIGLSIRGVLALGLPWAIGLAVGSTTAAMWISYGAMCALLSEASGGYRSRFRSAALAPLFGVVGFLAVGLDAMPWSVTVITMAVFGFVASVASQYSSLLSKGMGYALMISAISIGLPGVSGWESVLLYLSGIAFYVLLLGIEALLMRGKTRDDEITAVLDALGHFAASRATVPSGNQFAPPEIEAARREVIASFTTLGAIAMRMASHHFRHGDEGARLATILAKGDATFVAITASQDKAALQAAAAALRDAASGGTVPPMRSDNAVGSAVNGLLGALAKASGTPATSNKAVAPVRGHFTIDQLLPPPAVVQSAAAVALCIGIAYSARWLVGIDERWSISADHWYWIPLTVSMVMRPELGSVFARAVLRTVGTIVGAMIGTVVVLLVPNGIWHALPIALCAGLMPVARQRSYAWLTAVMTPVVLMFLNILDPGPADYALLRIENTAIGGAIVLIFGYFIWPRTHFREISSAFDGAKQSIADYILATIPGDGRSADSQLRMARIKAYQSLMNMRAHLQSALAEPPPASNEAAAWFPLTAAAERICDHVTVYEAQARAPVPPADAEALTRLAAYIVAAPDERQQDAMPSCAGCSAPVVALFDEIGRELQHMERLRDDDAFQATARRAHRRHAILS